MPPVAPQVRFAQDHAGTVQCQSRERGRRAPHAPGFARTPSTLEPALPWADSRRTAPTRQLPQPPGDAVSQPAGSFRSRHHRRTSHKVFSPLLSPGGNRGPPRDRAGSPKPAPLPLGCPRRPPSPQDEVRLRRQSRRRRAKPLSAAPGARCPGWAQPPARPPVARRLARGPAGTSGGRRAGAAPQRPARPPRARRGAAGLAGPPRGKRRRRLPTAGAAAEPTSVPRAGPGPAAPPPAAAAARARAHAPGRRPSRGVAEGPGEGCEAPAGLGQPRLPRPAAVYGGRPGCLSARRPAPPRPRRHGPGEAGEARPGRGGRGALPGEAGPGRSPRAAGSLCCLWPRPAQSCPAGRGGRGQAGEASPGAASSPRPPVEVLRAFPRGMARLGSFPHLHELPCNFIFCFTYAVRLAVAQSHLEGVANF